MAAHQFLPPPPAHRPSAWDASDDNSAMLEISKKAPHSLFRTFSGWWKLPSWIGLEKLDYRLILVLGQSLIQIHHHFGWSSFLAPRHCFWRQKISTSHPRIWTTYGKKMPALDLVVTKLDFWNFLTHHFSSLLFWNDFRFQRALKARMAYKYQPIKDEMFVSDDEAVSNQNLFEGKL